MKNLIFGALAGLFLWMVMNLGFANFSFAVPGTGICLGTGIGAPACNGNACPGTASPCMDALCQAAYPGSVSINNGNYYYTSSGVNHRVPPNSCQSACQRYEGTIAAAAAASCAASFSFTSNSSYDFRNVVVNSASPTINVTVQNTSSVNTTSCFYSDSDGGTNFNFSQGNCGALAAGASCSLTIQATPQSTGSLPPDVITISCAEFPFGSLQSGNYTVTGVAACTGGQYLSGGTCTCPNNYTFISGACTPNLPNGPASSASGPASSSEFFIQSGYPICGPGRLPMKSNLSTINIASSGVPNTADQAILYGQTYLYSTIAGTSPNQYPLYDYTGAGLTHCGCINHTVPAVPSLTTGYNFLSSTVGTNTPRFGGDTLDYINSLGANGLPNKVYGQVSMALDEVSDGRVGMTYSEGSSVCACPNVNEVPTRLSLTDPLSGVQCLPFGNLASDPNKVFAVFDPINDATQVQTGSTEPIKAGTTSQIVSKVSLPINQFSSSTLNSYSRHIWKCQIGYTLDSNGNCQFALANNACDSTSPVASGASWDSLFNKKLACCLNQSDASTTNSASVKFDCIDNSGAANNFNSLWAQSDTESEGGQLNALLLTVNGKPITGFYTLNGARCNEYTEFSTNPIQTGTINPAVIGSGAFVATGSITQPTSSGWNTVQAGLSEAGKTVTAADPGINLAGAIHCPILVRAALEVHCPKMSTVSNSPQYTIKDSDGILRCPAAQSIQVHIRTEQVFQIIGQPTMNPIDTIVDQKNAAAISIDKILSQKAAISGNPCLPGMHLVSSGCRY